ncbi:MAG TPA: energy transducer TonB [Candidatus Aquilonibacter sp.]|nr:energy transducer TonB [Candidatus Aquilonibacter sp.]
MRHRMIAICLFVLCAGATLAQDQPTQSTRASSSAPPAETTAPVAKPLHIRVGANIMEANLIKRVTPHYPQKAIEAHISGTVTLRVVVGTDGNVKDVQAVSGPPLFLQPSADALRQWQYKPVLLDGSAVEAETTVSVVFTLQGSPYSLSPKVEIYNPNPPAQAPNDQSSSQDAESASPSDAETAAKHVKPPRLLKQFKPKYPKAAKKAGISGTVVLHATIGTDGHVYDLTFVSGPEELEQAAMDAVSKWIYAPLMLNGEPKDTSTTISVVFTLGD